MTDPRDEQPLGDETPPDLTGPRDQFGFDTQESMVSQEIENDPVKSELKRDSSASQQNVPVGKALLIVSKSVMILIFPASPDEIDEALDSIDEGGQQVFPGHHFLLSKE